MGEKLNVYVVLHCCVYVSNCSMYFTFATQFSSLNDLIRSTIFVPILKIRKLEKERLSNLTEIIHLVSDRVVIWIQANLSPYFLSSVSCVA